MGIQESVTNFDFVGIKSVFGSKGDLGLIPGSGRSPGEGNGNPLQYSCLEGYSPWGHKESDTTEQLNNDNKRVFC